MRTRYSLFFTMEWAVTPEHYLRLILNSPYGSAGIQVCFILFVTADSLLVYFSKGCIIVISLNKSYLPYSENFVIATNLNKVAFSTFNWKASKLYICHGFTNTETGKKRLQLFFQHILSFTWKRNQTVSFWNIIFLLAHANFTLIFIRELTTAVSYCYVNKPVN